MDSLAVEDNRDAAASGGRLSPEEIAGLLVLEPVEADLFRDHGVPGETGRLFGGQVAAQALAAAGHTVTGTRPHSLHAYFLRAGDAGRPVLFQVDRLHDGRTFHRRRVTAIQDGEAVLCLECSFTADTSEATDYHPAPPVPAPEECPSFSKDDQATGRLTRPTSRHPRGRRDVTGVTSLDHSLWFHHRPDLSDWLLYAKTAPAVGPARGLSTGHIFDRRGTLIASVAQEVLLHARSRT